MSTIALLEQARRGKQELRSTVILRAAGGLAVGRSDPFADGGTHEQSSLSLWLCSCVIVAAAIVDSAGAMAAMADALARF